MGWTERGGVEWLTADHFYNAHLLDDYYYYYDAWGGEWRENKNPFVYKLKHVFPTILRRVGWESARKFSSIFHLSPDSNGDLIVIFKDHAALTYTRQSMFIIRIFIFI